MKMRERQDGFGYDLREAMTGGNFIERVFHRRRLSFWSSAIDYTGKKVLDVGCNTGIILIPLAERGVDVRGVDVSREEVRRAKQNLAGLGISPSRVGLADAKGLPFRAGEFDVVLLADILEHMDRPEVAAHEALRVVKKGGLILASVPNEWHPVVRYTWLRSLLSGRGNVTQFPDKPFNLSKLTNLFPGTEMIESRLVAFGTAIFCQLRKK